MYSKSPACSTKEKEYKNNQCEQDPNKIHVYHWHNETTVGIELTVHSKIQQEITEQSANPRQPFYAVSQKCATFNFH